MIPPSGTREKNQSVDSLKEKEKVKSKTSSSFFSETNVQIEKEQEKLQDIINNEPETEEIIVKEEQKLVTNFTTFRVLKDKSPIFSRK